MQNDLQLLSSPDCVPCGYVPFQCGNTFDTDFKKDKGVPMTLIAKLLPKEEVTCKREDKRSINDIHIG